MKRGSHQPLNRPGQGVGFALGGFIAMISTTAAQAYYPFFTTRSYAISYLGGTGVPTQLFWDSSIIAAGILWILGTYLLPGKRNAVISAVMYLAGFGFLLVGVSPWNYLPTTHYLGANMVFILGSISCILSSRIVKGTFALISILAGAFSIFWYLSGYIGAGSLLGGGGV